MRKSVCVRLMRVAQGLSPNEGLHAALYKALKRRYRELPWLKRKWWLKGMERYVEKLKEEKE